MLVLSRKNLQEIMVGDDIKITILQVKGNTVRIGIEAPRNVRVRRAELEPEADQVAEPMPTFTLTSRENKDRLILPFSGQAGSDGESESDEIQPQGRFKRLKQLIDQMHNPRQ